MIDFLLSMQGLKRVKRCTPYDRAFHESVADHSFEMVAIATNLVTEYKIDVDFARVVRLCIYHDLCELGLDHDYDSYAAHADKSVAREKTQYENRTMEAIAQKFNRPDILECWNEYEQAQTREARFVKAIDKIEAVLHLCAIPDGKITNPEFVATYCHDAVRQFPEIAPFYALVEQKIKARLEMGGQHWQKEFSI